MTQKSLQKPNSPENFQKLPTELYLLRESRHRIISTFDVLRGKLQNNRSEEIQNKHKKDLKTQ